MADENKNIENIESELNSSLQTYEKEIFSTLEDVLYENFNEEYVKEYLVNERDRIFENIRQQLNERISVNSSNIHNALYSILNTILKQCNETIAEKYNQFVEDNKSSIQTEYRNNIKKQSNGVLSDALKLVKNFNNAFENRMTVNIQIPETKLIHSEDIQNVQEIEEIPTEEREEVIPTEIIEESEKDTGRGFFMKSKAVNQITATRISNFRKFFNALKDTFAFYSKMFLVNMFDKFKKDFFQSENIWTILWGIGYSIVSFIRNLRNWWRIFKSTKLGKIVDEWMNKSIDRFKNSSLIKKLREGIAKPVSKFVDAVKNKLLRFKKVNRIFFNRTLPKYIRGLKDSFLNSKFMTFLKNNKIFKTIGKVFGFLGKTLKTIGKTVIAPFKILFKSVKGIVNTAKSIIGYISKFRQSGGFFGIVKKFVGRLGLAKRMFVYLRRFGGFIKTWGGKLLKFLGGLFDIVEGVERFVAGDWMGGLIKTVLGVLEFIPYTAPFAMIGSTVLSMAELTLASVVKSTEAFKKHPEKFDFIMGDTINHTKVLAYNIKNIGNMFSKIFSPPEEKVVYKYLENGKFMLKDRYDEMSVKNIDNENRVNIAREMNETETFKEEVFNDIQTNGNLETYRDEQKVMFDFVNLDNIALNAVNIAPLTIPDEVNLVIQNLQSRVNILPQRIKLA